MKVFIRNILTFFAVVAFFATTGCGKYTERYCRARYPCDFIIETTVYDTLIYMDSVAVHDTILQPISVIEWKDRVVIDSTDRVKLTVTKDSLQRILIRCKALKDTIKVPKIEIRREVQTKYEVVEVMPNWLKFVLIGAVTTLLLFVLFRYIT